MKMNMRFGFTLAEVLIALSIVGVVAAITVPQVINNYNEKAFEALELKAKDTLTQAFDIYLSNLGKNRIKSSDFDSKEHVLVFLTKYTRGKRVDLQNSGYRTETGGAMSIISGNTNYGCVKSNDGIMICLRELGSGGTGVGKIIFDLNGSAGPNMKNTDLIMDYRYDTTGRVYK